MVEYLPFAEIILLFFDDGVSMPVRQGILSLLTFILCLICLPVRKSFFEQCSAAGLHEPLSVLKNGLALYGILIGLSAIFLLSVVGYPVAAALVVVIVALSLMGHLSLGILLGSFIAPAAKLKKHTGTNFVMGFIAIEILKFIPYVRWGMYTFVLPVLSIGLISTGVLNGFIKKKYYIVDEPYENAATNHKQMRRIILGVKKENE